MTSVELLLLQIKDVHETQEATMADVTDTIANQKQTNHALPIGAAYAHSVLSEDKIVSTILSTDKPLYQTETDIGLSELMPEQEEWDKHDSWAQTVQMDVAKFKAYAEKVYARTEKVLEKVKDEELAEMIDVPGMGERQKAYLWSGWVILHIANLTGEISAAKGFQGLKGYPW